MSQTYSLAGVSVAVGMDWRSLRSDTSEKNEAVEILKQEGMTHGTIFIADSISFVGMYPGEEAGSPFCGAACLAAAALKRKIDNFVVIETLTDDGDMWFCAIRNGAPLKGYDRIVNISEVPGLISELNQNYNNFNFYSNGGVIHGTESGSFIDIAGEEGRIPSEFPRVTRLIGVSKRFLYLIGSLISVVAVLYFGYSYMTNKAATLAAVEAATNLQLKQMATKAEIAKAISDANEDIARQFSAKIGSVPLYFETIDGWLNSIADAPEKIAGWRLLSVECSTLNCSIKYKREKGGTLLEFLDAVKSQGLQTGVVTGNEVSIVYLLNQKSRNFSVDQLPPEKEGLWKMLTQFQLMELAKLSFIVQDAEPIFVMTAKLPERPPEKITSTWKIGSYTLSGSKLFEIRDSSDYVQLDYVTALSLKINIDTGLWSIGGSYATK